MTAHLPTNPTIEQIFEFKYAYKVSATAATYAMPNAERMTDRFYRTTCNKLGGLGCRTVSRTRRAGRSAAERTTSSAPRPRLQLVR